MSLHRQQPTGNQCSVVHMFWYIPFKENEWVHGNCQWHVGTLVASIHTFNNFAYSFCSCLVIRKNQTTPAFFLVIKKNKQTQGWHFLSFLTLKLLIWSLNLNFTLLTWELFWDHPWTKICFILENAMRASDGPKVYCCSTEIMLVISRSCTIKYWSALPGSLMQYLKTAFL